MVRSDLLATAADIKEHALARNKYLVRTYDMRQLKQEDENLGFPLDSQYQEGGDKELLVGADTLHNLESW